MAVTFDSSKKNTVVNRLGVIARVAFGVALIFALFLLSQVNYLAFHETVEIFSIVIAFGIFLIVWNSYRHLQNNFFIIFAVGIAFSAFFDLLHMITYKGMGIIKFDLFNPSNLATQLWLVARFIQAGTYLFAILILRKTERYKLVALYSIISVLLLISIFVLRIFPVAYINGHLTEFKKISEYAISAMFLVSAFLVYRRKAEFDKIAYRFLIISLIITTFAELSFTLYTDVYGIMNFIGHTLKIMSFYFLYRAIIVVALDRPHEFLFHKVLSEEERLKRNQNELRFKNRLLEKEKSEDEALLSSIVDGIVAMDRKGKIQFTNPAFNKLIGMAPNEIVGRVISDVFPFFDEEDQEVPKEERPLWIAVAQTKFSLIKRTNFHFMNPTGQRVDLSITAAPVFDQGKITGGIVVFRDVTKEKETERTKTEYISFAAHQLRTPLATIRLTMEVLSSELKKKNPKDVDQYLKDIIEESDIMTETVDHFLNVTKIEAGIFSIRPILSDVSQLLSDQLRLFLPQLENKGMKMETELDVLLPAIKIDPKILEIIIDNLVSNAIKYSRDGGVIKIKSGKKNRNFIISIADNGFGIPKADQSKVFIKMFRASNISNSEGTGIGLYIVRLLIEQSGGKIWFESSDEGTTFHVSYPLSGMKEKKVREL